jgi:hypothetical protein
VSAQFLVDHGRLISLRVARGISGAWFSFPQAAELTITMGKSDKVASRSCAGSRVRPAGRGATHFLS